MTRAEYRDQRPIPEVLTPEHASKLLFFSFKYSQGQGELQTFLIDWLCQTNSTWRLSVTDLDTIMTLTQDRIYRYFGRSEDNHTALKPPYHRSIHADVIKAQVKIYTETMQYAAHGRLRNSHCFDYLVPHLINADFNYLSRHQGRFRMNTTKNNPNSDQYQSQLLWYGALGHNCEMPEYSHIFEDVWQYIQSGELSDKSKVELWEVINIYQQHHPTQRLALLDSCDGHYR